MNSWLQQLLLWQKFALIGVLSAILVTIPTAMYWLEADAGIRLARQQERGEETAVQLLSIMRLVQQHRGLSGAVLAGNAALTTQRDARADELQAAFAAVDAVMRANYSHPQTLAEWAGSGSEWSAIRGAIRAGTLEPADSFARHTALVANLMLVLDRVMDESGLSVDPEVASASLIAATMVELPALAEVLGQTRALGSAYLARGNASDAERARLDMLLDRVTQHLASAERAFSKTFAAQPGLQPLQAELQVASQRVSALQALARSEVVNADPPTYDSSEFFGRSTEAIDTLFALNGNALKGLFELLETRVRELTWQKYQLALLILFAVGAGAALGLAVVRSIMRQLGGEPAYATAVVRRIAAGDLSEPVVVAGHGPSLLGDMRDMQGTLQAFVDAQIEMARQHELGEIDHRIDAAAFPGSFGRIGESLNALVAAHIDVKMRAIALMGRYAVGDLTRDMDRLPGKKAVITETMDAVKGNLLAVNRELQRLVAAAADGDFSARGAAGDFQFAFREMVEGLNTLMQQADDGLGDVGNVLDALASGDLTRKVTREYRGAFGKLAGDANATVDRLAGIIGSIKVAVEAIDTAAREIAAGNSDLSGRTEQQAANLEETASSMEELTSTVRQNAENSRQARQLSVGAAEVAVQGGDVVGRVVTTMEAIRASSRRIEDIIGAIDGIAFQTNILALNAAVEAARAGEQGRGFAVVASEVRSLAQRAAESAKEIKGLIAESVATVESGSTLVHEAGRTMSQIVDAVKRVTDIMGEIAAASDEQTSGIEQVNQTIIHMDQVTQQNAALVEEASAAARALETQASGLRDEVAMFRLSSHGDGMDASDAQRLPHGIPTRGAMPRASRGREHAPEAIA